MGNTINMSFSVEKAYKVNLNNFFEWMKNLSSPKFHYKYPIEFGTIKENGSSELLATIEMGVGKLSSLKEVCPTVYDILYDKNTSADTSWTLTPFTLESGDDVLCVQGTRDDGKM